MKTKLYSVPFVARWLLILFSSQAGAQPTIQWQAVFGGTNFDEISSILETGDGGYLLGGASSSGATGNKTNVSFGQTDFWLIKVNSNGVKQWEQIYGGRYGDSLTAMLPAGDGGYFLAGPSSSDVSGNKTIPAYGGALFDYWLVKVDANGNKLWEAVYGGDAPDYLHSLRRAADTNLFLGGFSRSGATGSKISTNFGGADFWLVKADTNGFQLWDKSFGGTGDEFIYTLLPTSDGGCLLGGESNSGISGNKTNAGFGLYDFWLVKVDANGNKQWDKSYGGTNSDELVSIQRTPDGGYLLAGTAGSGVSGNKTNAGFGAEDYWVVKVDANGNKQWDKSYGGANEDYLDEMIPTSDGNYLIGGYSYSLISGNKTNTNYGLDDYWVVKIDPNGNILWQQAYGGSDYDEVFALVATSDKGLLLGGSSRSPVSGNKTDANFGNYDFWAIKLSPETPPRPQLTIARSGPNAVLSWPSPSTGFGLEQNGNLGTTSWNSVTQTPADNGTNKSVTLPIASTNTFFRLKKP